MNPVHSGQMASSGEALPQTLTKFTEADAVLTRPMRYTLADALELHAMRNALKAWFLSFQDHKEDYLLDFELDDSSIFYDRLDSFLAHNQLLHLQHLQQSAQPQAEGPLLEAALEAVRQAAADHYSALISEKDAHIADLKEDKAQLQALLSKAPTQATPSDSTTLTNSIQ